MVNLTYALQDRRDGSVRYVGRTSDPYARMTKHLSDRDPDGSPKQRWMHEMREAGYRPKMLPLECAEHGPAASESEARWIAHYMELGELLNSENDLRRGRSWLRKQGISRAKEEKRAQVGVAVAIAIKKAKKPYVPPFDARGWGR